VFRPCSASNGGSAHAALGDKDQAFKMLFKLLEVRDEPLYIKVDPPLEALHSDPRWDELLRRANLPTD
jgi:hypothetical protein